MYNIRLVLYIHCQSTGRKRNRVSQSYQGDFYQICGEPEYDRSMAGLVLDYNGIWILALIIAQTSQVYKPATVFHWSVYWRFGKYFWGRYRDRLSDKLQLRQRSNKYFLKM